MDLINSFRNNKSIAQVSLSAVDYLEPPGKYRPAPVRAAARCFDRDTQFKRKTRERPVNEESWLILDQDKVYLAGLSSLWMLSKNG